MERFYFTYGTAEQYPFRGGWTTVCAPDEKTAIAFFRALHPDVHENTLNCAGVYSDEAFKKTEMWVKGNLGATCHELISVERVGREEA